MANVCLCLERLCMLQLWRDMDGDGFIGGQDELCPCSGCPVSVVPCWKRCCPPAPLPAAPCCRHRGSCRARGAHPRQEPSSAQSSVTLEAVDPQQGSTELKSTPVVWEALEEPAVTSGTKPCCGGKQLLMLLYLVGWTAAWPMTLGKDKVPCVYFLFTYKKYLGSDLSAVEEFS